MSRAEHARLLLQRVRRARQSPEHPGGTPPESVPEDDVVGELLSHSVRAAVVRSGRSLAFLARAARVPYASLHGFIHGKQDIHLRLASRLCAVLGLRLTNMGARANGNCETIDVDDGERS